MLRKTKIYIEFVNPEKLDNIICLHSQTFKISAFDNSFFLVVTNTHINIQNVGFYPTHL
jgi:hypothetical protein